MSKNWYVITGAPSSGKSTVIKKLAELGHPTQQEFGRLLIEKEMAGGKSLENINVDSIEFEETWIKLQIESEKKLNPDSITFLDRGIVDTLAYFRYYGWTVPENVKNMCEGANYNNTIFLFEQVGFEDDGKRIESAQAAAELGRLFGVVYKEYGYKIIRVPALSLEERVKIILDTVNLDSNL